MDPDRILSKLAVAAFIELGLSIEWDIVGTLTFKRSEWDESTEQVIRRRRRSKPVSRARARRWRRSPKDYAPASFKRADHAWEYLTKRLARKVLPRALATGQAILWLRSIERHADGQHHIHFLAAAPKNAWRKLTVEDVLRVWVGDDPLDPKFGWADVRLYKNEPAQRTVRYCVKQGGGGGDVIYSDAVKEIQHPEF